MPPALAGRRDHPRGPVAGMHDAQPARALARVGRSHGGAGAPISSRATRAGTIEACDPPCGLRVTWELRRQDQPRDRRLGAPTATVTGSRSSTTRTSAATPGQSSAQARPLSARGRSAPARSELATARPRGARAEAMNPIRAGDGSPTRRHAGTSRLSRNPNRLTGQHLTRVRIRRLPSMRTARRRRRSTSPRLLLAGEGGGESPCRFPRPIATG
jgi:hypothetical protein